MNPMGMMTASNTRIEPWANDANRHVVTWLICGALIIGAAAAVLFAVFPHLDLDTSRYFYRGNGVFSGKSTGIFSGGPPTTVSDVIRLVLYFSFIGVCVLNVIALIASFVLKGDVFRLGFVKWLFLAACLVIGPGLVGNEILKDHWGRARPVHLSEFGGTKKYTSPLMPSDECRRNCSFVAGEASMMYAVFFSAAFLFPEIAGVMIVAGVAAGLFAGFIRISQGAHFLSDVIFAGVTMALTVAGVYLVFKTIARSRAANQGQLMEDPLNGRSLW